MPCQTNKASLLHIHLCRISCSEDKLEAAKKTRDPFTEAGKVLLTMMFMNMPEHMKDQFISPTQRDYLRTQFRKDSNTLEAEGEILTAVMSRGSGSGRYCR